MLAILRDSKGNSSSLSFVLQHVTAEGIDEQMNKKTEFQLTAYLNKTQAQDQN